MDIVKLCCDCKKPRENPNKGCCNECGKRRSREWRERVKAGKPVKPRTNLCACGNPKAPNLHSYCQPCATKQSIEWRKKHGWTQEEKQRRKERQRENYVRKRPPSNKSSYYSEEHAIKSRVRALTRAYIKAGKLIKDSCEICKTTKWVEAHHDDYTKPMDIRWLCKKHHAEFHKNLKLNKE